MYLLWERFFVSWLGMLAKANREMHNKADKQWREWNERRMGSV